MLISAGSADEHFFEGLVRLGSVAVVVEASAFKRPAPSAASASSQSRNILIFGTAEVAFGHTIQYAFCILNESSTGMTRRPLMRSVAASAVRASATPRPSMAASISIQHQNMFPCRCRESLAERLHPCGQPCRHEPVRRSISHLPPEAMAVTDSSSADRPRIQCSITFDSTPSNRKLAKVQLIKVQLIEKRRTGNIRVGHVATISGARTSLLVPEMGRARSRTPD
jgi:hypothetical protein